MNRPHRRSPAAGAAGYARPARAALASAAWTRAGFVVAALAAGGVSADELRVLLPFPEGTPVAPGASVRVGVVQVHEGAWVKLGSVEVSASAGEVGVVPSADPFVAEARAHVPLAPGDVTITARSGGLSAQAPLHVDAAALGALTIVAEPDHLTKGAGAETAVIHVVAGDPRVPPSVAASTGFLGPLVEEGPGKWKTTYTCGPARYPEVAVITVAQPWPDEGSPAFSLAHVVVPLSAAIVLPGETRPKVQMTVEIAGTKFGPVPSDEKGRFEIPIVVPPGHGTGQGVSLDHFGNRRSTTIDLRLPPTNRIAASVWPRTLIADGHAEAEIAVVVVDKTGAPATEVPAVRANLGGVGAVRSLGGGRYRARYTGPSAPGSDVVEVRLKDGSRASVPIAVRPGAPARVKASVEPPLMSSPSSVTGRVTVDVADAFVHGVPDARLDVRARHGGTTVRVSDKNEVTYTAPSVLIAWSDPIRVRARGADGVHAARLVFTPGSGVVAVDAWDRPVPRAEVRVPKAVVRADDNGVLPLAVTALAGAALSATLDGSAAAARLFVDKGADGALHGWPGHPGTVATEAMVELMEPTPIDVHAEILPSGEVQWRIDGDGTGPRKVAIAAPGVPPQVIEKRAGKLAVALPKGAPVTVTDVESGVSSVVFTPP